MPLQIRRGTEAERTAMTQPLAQGELLYVTNDQRLYIGNGATLGGVQITGYTNEDAQDAAALLFSNGSHTGITFTYNDTSASLSAALDLSNFSGTIRADAFKGSVFADDGSTIGGTLLVDAVDGVLRGTHIGTVTGNTTGSHKGNVLADDNDIMINAATKQIGFAGANVIGNTTGYHTGDVKGSIFGDDSSPLVDGVSNSIGNLTTTYRGVEFNGGNNSIVFKSANPTTIKYNGIIDTGAPAEMTLSVSRGTLDVPTNTVANDVLGGFRTAGYYNGNYKFASNIITQWASDADLTSNNPKSNVLLVIGDNSSYYYIAQFSGQGNFTAPTIQPGVYTNGTTRDAAITAPGAGMMVFNVALQKFQGYVSDTGLAGGGAPNSTAGWINLN